MHSQLARQEIYPVIKYETVLTPIKGERSEVAINDHQRSTEKRNGIEQWINTKDLKQTVLIFRAINHPLRKSIMNLLYQKGTMTVTEIYICLRLDQSVASQHLKILRNAGVVKTEKSGKFISYSLNEYKLNQLSQLISIVVSFN